jgi:uncharacterized DUF497 family protein
MQFEWDEAKRHENLRKYGFDFSDANLVFDGATITLEDDRFENGEIRFITFGLLHGRVVAVAHTEHGTAIRIISIRIATRYEQENYFYRIPHGLESD